MARPRAASVPVKEGANPFWSSRAQEEFLVQAARPEDLPVPETPSASVTARRSRQSESGGEGSGRIRSRSTKTGKGGKIPVANGAYVTPPSSWVEKGAVKEERHGPVKIGAAAESDDSLQRGLEKEVVELLHQENQQLKQELLALKEEKKVQKELELRVQQEMAKRRAESGKDDGSVDSWMKVGSNGSGSQPPPPPVTPKTTMMWTTPEESRFTPGGTRVPDGVPPQDGPVVPPPPSWMSGNLEWSQEDHYGEAGHRVLGSDRAFEHGEHRHGGRAWSNHREPHRDRAFAARDGIGGCDRAFMGHNGVYGGDRAQHGVSYHGHQDGHQQHPGIAHSDPRGGNSKSMEMEAGRTMGSDRSGEELQEEINRLQKKLDEQKGKSWTKRSVDAGYWQFPEGEGNEGRREERGSMEETLRSVPITLPKLVDPSVKNASLEAGDWIAQIKPYVSDVAPGAAAWWENLVRVVTERYNEWLQANPLKRVYLTPPDPLVASAGHARLDQRVTTLLLGAFPETLRTELVTTRQLTVSGAMFSVMKRYQPGGVAERSQTLMELTSKKSAASPLIAVQQLRLWKRQKNRALELGLALPDPLILVRAVDNIMRDLLGRHQEASFRVSAFRMQHQLDVRPTLASGGGSNALWKNRRRRGKNSVDSSCEGNDFGNQEFSIYEDVGPLSLLG